MSSYTKKSLRFVIALGTGKFGSSANNQITMEGFRASVMVDKAGGQQMSTLRAQVYGVSQSDMNSITTLQWKPGDQISNTVQVYAIDGNQQTRVFSGYIVNAWGNYQSSPDVYLEIQAQSAYLAQVAPVSPLSFKGSIDVATVMKQLADTMKLTFENNGVTGQLPPTYLAGTALDQVKALQKASGINLYIDDDILAITPPNTPRATIGKYPQLYADSGLKGYPTFDAFGVNFEVLFNPLIKFGGRLRIGSSITKASGEWIVVSLAHNLESEKPNGAWFSLVRANKSGLAIV